MSGHVFDMEIKKKKSGYVGYAGYAGHLHSTQKYRRHHSAAVNDALRVIQTIDL